MAMTQRPTEAQLRQHALDRALCPEMIKEVGLYKSNTANVEALANDIIKVADRFKAYLQTPEPDAATDATPESVIWAYVGKATTEQLINDLEARLVRVPLGEEAERVRSLLDILPQAVLEAVR